MKTLTTGDNAVLSSDASKLKTINKLADAFAKQEDISSKDALTAATQEGLLNALNDEEVVTLTTAQRRLREHL